MSGLSEEDVFRRVVAFHEAGHVVVAWALGVPSKGVEIGAGGGEARHKSFRLELMDKELQSSGDCDRVIHSAKILLGGQLAEVIAGRSADMAGEFFMSDAFEQAAELTKSATETWSDRCRIIEIATEFSDCWGCNPNDWIQGLENEVEELLEGHWEKVCAIAESLVCSGILSGLEVDSLLANGGDT